MREALYYEQRKEKLACLLCPKHCVIGEGGTGFCRARQNIGGKLYSLNYGQATAQALDPIEKKPLYHFWPGSSIFSLGTWGCNFACKFCQNWHIAHEISDAAALEPNAAARMASHLAGRNNIGIAYTYSEPSVWFEYILDTAQAVKAAGQKNVLVTNGFINEKPLKELLPYIDAMNIDVKAFNDDYYEKICAGQLAKVKHTVEIAAKACHVEITTLVVPGLNDSDDELEELAVWLSGINPDIPLHFSRYFPNYKMDAPPTPPATLEKAYKLAKQTLNYVYIGNFGGEGVNTYCPECGLKVIDRISGSSRLTDEKKCPECGRSIYIIGEVNI